MQFPLSFPQDERGRKAAILLGASRGSHAAVHPAISDWYGCQVEYWDAYRLSSENRICSFEPMVSYLPCRFGDESGEGEPIVVFIFLEIGVRDKEEMIEERGIFFCDNTFPYLYVQLRIVFLTVRASVPGLRSG